MRGRSIAYSTESVDISYCVKYNGSGVKKMISFTSLRHAYPEPAGFCIKRKHGHENYTFLHFFNSVDLLSEGKIVKTEPHGFIIYDIDAPQYFLSRPPLLHDWMHFVGDAGKILRENGIEFNKLYYPAQSQFITELVREIETEFYGTKQNSQELMHLKFQELMIKLGRSVSSEHDTDVGEQARKQLQTLRGKMFMALGEKWTVARMAKELGLSESRFYGLYKACYGISPTADLIEVRINSAKNMLSFGKHSVEWISRKLGYENTTHFIRQFKARTGQSPTAYRKSHNE